MANTAGNSAYAGDGAPAVPMAGTAGTQRIPTVGPSHAVAVGSRGVLGAATFAVSFALAGDVGFPVQLSVFAAIVAAVGLLRGQAGAAGSSSRSRSPASWTRPPPGSGLATPGWALSVIMVLNALQSLAAVGALLRETRTAAVG